MSETTLIEREFVATMRDPDDADMAVRNAIHTTDGAKRFGFQGALVGGVTLYGWCVPTIIGAFGEDWLDRGWILVNFRRPTYPGTRLQVRIARADDGSSTLVATNDDGEVCLRGDLGIGDAPWLADFQLSSNRVVDPPSDDKEQLTLDAAPRGQDLRTLGFRISAADARAFGAEQIEPDPLFTGEHPLVHPSVLARHMISLLGHSYDYGRPAIHVSSHIQHLARATAGQELVLTGHFIDAYEKRGHHYAVIDGDLFGEDGTELARIRHTNIFRVATRD